MLLTRAGDMVSYSLELHGFHNMCFQAPRIRVLATDTLLYIAHHEEVKVSTIDGYCMCVYMCVYVCVCVFDLLMFCIVYTYVFSFSEPVFAWSFVGSAY